jgi:hypothetical protein
VLGPDTEIEIEAFDECNNFVDVRAIAKRIRKAGGGMVGLVGVQSNQFPRALDLGREFRALGVPVVMGGFHVSGCLAMLPKIPPEMQEALDLGIHLFAGEAEGRMADVLREVANGTAKPIYNYLDNMPELSSAVPPILPTNLVKLVLTAAAVRFSAASAPSSTCKAAYRATARPTTSRRSCAPMRRRASPAFSSPTTISPATATGKPSSTA